MKNSTTLNKVAGIILSAVFWIAVWGIVSQLVGYEYILPSPLATVKEWLRLSATGVFWQSTLRTLVRVVIGFVLGVILGVALGVLTFKSRLLSVLLSPLIKIIKVIPVASFIIVMLVWIQSEYLPIFISGMMVLPIIWQITFDELSLVDKNLLEMATVFGLSRFEIWTKIIFRSVLPQLLTGSITALGFAWKSGVAAEVISSPSVSIGRYLLRAKTSLETTSVFAWTINVILLSFLLEGLLKLIVKKSFKEDRDGKA